MDLDELLGALEAKPLKEQFSELGKNDPFGVPLYVRGVVLTKARYDSLLRSEARPETSTAQAPDEVVPPVNGPAVIHPSPPQWWEDWDD